MRQLLTESVLLAGLGGLGGLVTTWWGMKVLVSMIPATMPRLKDIQIDGHALAFTLLISFGTALVFGLAPALRASRAPVNEALKQGENRATISAGWRRYRSALVVAEVALTLVLLAGAGLMIQSVVKLLSVKPGFDQENLLQVRAHLPAEKYDGPEKQQSKNLLIAQLRERLAALPGVIAVGIGNHYGPNFKLEHQEGPVQINLAGSGVGESDLFQAMRVPLLAGRYFNKDDIAEDVFYRNENTEGTSTVIINEAMARLSWPGKNALGQKFRKAETYSKRTYEVVGIVSDIRDYRYDQRVEPTFYRPYQEVNASPTFMLRTAGDPRPLIPAIRRELKAAEPDMSTPIIGVVSQALYDRTQGQRTYMLYMVVFAAVGLVLAAVGIYGVLAYSVARRTREIGIRIAVGAERRHVLGMVLAEGVRLIIIGEIVGLLATFWLTKFLRSQLFEVSPTNPAILTGVVLFLFAAALLACWLPARRAAKVDPMVAFRCE
jgi:putative ABC transport system permease protein